MDLALNVIFLRAVPYEIAFVICGILLFGLALTVFFPVIVARMLTAIGLAGWMSISLFSVSLSAVETLMLLTGLAA